MLLLGAAPACGQDNAAVPFYVYEQSIDTEDKTITLQSKKQYHFAAKGITVDNQFEGARLNNAQLSGNTLKVVIAPENTPVNGSSWYAFRIRSRKAQTVTIELNYTYSTHRYLPRVSTDQKEWTVISKQKLKLNKAGDRASFTLNLSAGTTWVAAQEIVPSSAVYDWCEMLGPSSHVHNRIIGKSVLGKDIPCLDIYGGGKNDKPIIALLGRHHPPEVPGHYALQYFVERLLSHNKANDFFKKYRVLVFPLINPDGVDLGHWRHNAAGVDLNRDYAQYQQPEIKSLTTFLAKEASENDAPVLMGLDFHATYEDVFYTSQETEGVALAAFKDQWLNAIRHALRAYDHQLKEEQHSVNSNPSAQHWFYHQFKALGITYEVGDNTERAFIKTKAEVSADALIKLLIED
ncbi:MAG TPA: M14 family metallopeptidase [Chitinophagaceae bacterium]|nr:M14 family metallopeptidase [Chitinophagaceae bacterium]